MPSAVTVEGLSRSYGSVVAVDGMTWSADSGRITAVLGPNGAGKTTSMACLEGLLRPDSGSVRVLGTDPWTSGPHHRARVGIMLQDGGLPNTVGALRVLRHVHGFYAHPLDIDELIVTLGIDAFGNTTVRRLSGGQRQRLALAVALVGDPDVLFLDEPTAGLDPHARIAVWDLIRSTRDRGKAVVVTTHSFEEADRLADDVVIVDAGRAVATGPLAQVRGDGSLEDVYFRLTSGGRVASHDPGAKR